MIRLSIEGSDLVGYSPSGDERLRVPMTSKHYNPGEVTLDGLTIGEAIAALKDATSGLDDQLAALRSERRWIIKDTIEEKIIPSTSWEVTLYTDFDGDEELRLVPSEDLDLGIFSGFDHQLGDEHEFKCPMLDEEPHIRRIEPETAPLPFQLERLLAFAEEWELDVDAEEFLVSYIQPANEMAKTINEFNDS